MLSTQQYIAPLRILKTCDKVIMSYTEVELQGDQGMFHIKLVTAEKGLLSFHSLYN